MHVVITLIAAMVGTSDERFNRFPIGGRLPAV